MAQVRGGTMDWQVWTLLAVASALVGLAKGGLSMIGMLSVPILSLGMSPVQAAAVLVREDRPGDRRLAACVAPADLPVAELRDTLLQLAQVTVCAQCAKRRDLVEADLLPGARIAGAAAFVEESLTEGVQALVY